MLLIGAGLLLAPLAVLYGDIQRLMRIVTRLLFYFSPILYGVNDVEDKLGTVSRPSCSSSTRSPASSTCTAARSSPTSGPAGAPSAVSAVFSVAIFALGVVVFRRLEGAVLKEI